MDWVRNVLLMLSVSIICVVSIEGLLLWMDFADPPAFQKDDVYGYLMQPRQSVSTRGNRFHINQAGFRGADFIVPKPNGLYRIAFVGDSITYGGGSIPEKDLFVNQVAVSLNPLSGKSIEPINLSAPGWGIPNMAAYIKTMGVHEADFLVWIIPAIDFRRPKRFLDDYFFPEDKPWSRVGYVSAIALNQILKVFSQSNSLNLNPHKIREQNLEILKLIFTQIIQEGIQAAIVVIPSKKELGSYQNDLSKFQTIAESLHIPFLELTSVFRELSAEELFLDEIHLNKHGHEQVARAMVPFLMKNFFKERGRTN